MHDFSMSFKKHVRRLKMIEIAEKLLKTFYELWFEEKWSTSIRNKGVPGIFLAIEAGIVSAKELNQARHKTDNIDNYASSKLHSKIAPVLIEMEERGWIKTIKNRYADDWDYNVGPWKDAILALWGRSIRKTDIDEVKRIERTGNELPEMWFFKITAKGKDHYKRLEVTQSLVNRILELQEKINQELGCELLIDKYKIIHNLKTSCLSEKEFPSHIQSLNLLIEKMRIKELGGSGDKTINFIENYFRQKGKDPTPITENLRDISILSSGSPRHEGTDINKRVEKVLRKWGFTQKPIDYRKLWETALERYIESLEKFLQLFKN